MFLLFPGSMYWPLMHISVERWNYTRRQPSNQLTHAQWMNYRYHWIHFKKINKLNPVYHQFHGNRWNKEHLLCSIHPQDDIEVGSQLPLLTLLPRLLFVRKGSITLKCLETNGWPWLSWVWGITPYAELHVSRKDLFSKHAPLSFRGGSAAWHNMNDHKLNHWSIKTKWHIQITSHIWKWTYRNWPPQAQTKFLPIKVAEKF
jgi:hypothetical protein